MDIYKLSRKNCVQKKFFHYLIGECSLYTWIAFKHRYQIGLGGLRAWRVIGINNLIFIDSVTYFIILQTIVIDYKNDNEIFLNLLHLFMIL
jgi:hypothetical protein